jgi:2-amino-4-hydroxy-6-hydroxymethyldihydropteridine diphosphokinase
MPRVYISIGSNIEREKNVRAAVLALKQAFGALTLSSVYETAAVGFQGDPFYNLVAAFDTGLPPEAVQEILKRIEAEHGRRRDDVSRFTSRTLDLDILLYGELVRHDAHFDIPRDELQRQAFVLTPLKEIAPALRHPETGRTFSDLWTELEKSSAPAVRVALDNLN